MASVRTVELNERRTCEVFCLRHGAFSPLSGFLDETASNAVVSGLRLPEKQLFGMPVAFGLHGVSGLQEGNKLLRRGAGEDAAVLEASPIFEPCR